MESISGRSVSSPHQHRTDRHQYVIWEQPFAHTHSSTRWGRYKEIIGIPYAFSHPLMFFIIGLRSFITLRNIVTKQQQLSRNKPKSPSRCRPRPSPASLTAPSFLTQAFAPPPPTAADTSSSPPPSSPSSAAPLRTTTTSSASPPSTPRPTVAVLALTWAKPLTPPPPTSIRTWIIRRRWMSGIAPKPCLVPRRQRGIIPFCKSVLIRCWFYDAIPSAMWSHTFIATSIFIHPNTHAFILPTLLPSNISPTTRHLYPISAFTHPITSHTPHMMINGD